MKFCRIDGCHRKHHARDLCTRHYNKWLKYGNPEEGRTYKPQKRAQSHKEELAAAEIIERRPLKARIPGFNNVSFQLNSKIIDKLYIEAAKACHEPVYKGLNGDALENILMLCIKMAGCHSSSPIFINDLLQDLRTWAGSRDRIRFMRTLETWPEKEEKYFSAASKQMDLFSVK